MVSVAIFTRVSTKSQDYQRQIADLAAYAQKMNYQVVATISEKVSATKKKNDERKGINELLELAKAKKINKILVTEVSRLGRRPSETLKLIEELTTNKISIYSQNFGLETLLPNGKQNPAASLIFLIYAEIARMETDALSERIHSGLDEARRKGVELGRKEGTTIDEKEFKKKYSKPMADLRAGLSIRKVAKIHSLSKGTIEKIKKLLLQ